MKVWILNNTKFDKNVDYNLYFETEFIPLLKKFSKDGDILVHLGNIFSNSDTINIKTLNNVIKLLSDVSEIIPIYFLDGYDTELLKLLKQLKNTIVVDKPLSINSLKLIPKTFNIPGNIDIVDKYIFINSQIDKDVLFGIDKNFICGFSDTILVEQNVTYVGSPYQFNKKSSYGIYVLDIESGKKKYFENNINSKFQKYRLTSIDQLESFDTEYIKNNEISIEIDKSLILEKTLKIEVLLNKFDFKSITYINDDNDDELIDNTSLDMEKLLLEKINASDNQDLAIEFKKILELYKNKY